MGWPVETFEENGWEYYVVEINQSGLGSALASIKDGFLVGLNAPGENSPIDSSSLVELIKIVHANIDDDGNYTNSSHENKSHESYITPLKQIASGVSTQDVTCKDGMTLVFKNAEDSSACVKPATVTKLVERDWARP